MNDLASLAELAGLAYDAALSRETWQSFVTRLGTAFDAVHAVIDPRATDFRRRKLSETAYVLSGTPCAPFNGNDLLMERAWRLPRGTLSVVQRMASDVSVGRSDFYTATLAPIDVGHAVHAFFSVPHDEVGFFCLTRFEWQPIFSAVELQAIQSVVGHLSRAFEIEERLAATPKLEVFENLAFGLMLIDRHGKVFRMNALAQQLVTLEDGLFMHAGALHLTTGKLNLEAYLERRCNGFDVVEVFPFSIERSQSEQPLSAMFSKVPTEWRIADRDELTLLVLSDPDWLICPPSQALVQLYQLTPREARLATALVRHRSLQGATAELAVSPETARRHLKAVFDKTRTHSQSELIGLLVSQPSARLMQPPTPARLGHRFKPAAE